MSLLTAVTGAVRMRRGRWVALGHTGGLWTWRGWAGAQAPGGEALGRVQDSGSATAQPGGSAGLGSVGVWRGGPGSLASHIPLLIRLESCAEGPSLPSGPGALGLGCGAAFAWGEEEPPGRWLHHGAPMTPRGPGPPGPGARWGTQQARPGHCQACAGPGPPRGSLRAHLRGEAPGAPRLSRPARLCSQVQVHQWCLLGPVHQPAQQPPGE